MLLCGPPGYASTGRQAGLSNPNGRGGQRACKASNLVSSDWPVDPALVGVEALARRRCAESSRVPWNVGCRRRGDDQAHSRCLELLWANAPVLMEGSRQHPIGGLAWLESC